MDIPLLFAQDYFPITSQIKWAASRIIDLVKSEVLRWTQAKSLKDVPYSVVSMVLKEWVQLVVYDAKHKVEVSFLWTSVAHLYQNTILHDYLPIWCWFLNDWKAGAAAWLWTYFVSRLIFIGLVWPPIRYHQKLENSKNNEKVAIVKKVWWLRKPSSKK